MNTQVWGPPLWSLLHGLSFHLTTVSAENTARALVLARTMLHRMQGALPCRFCRESYAGFWKEMGPRLDSLENFPAWMYALHARVNDKLGVSRAPSFADVSRRQRLVLNCYRLQNLWIILLILAANLSPANREATYRFIMSLFRVIYFALLHGAAVLDRESILETIGGLAVVVQTLWEDAAPEPAWLRRLLEKSYYFMTPAQFRAIAAAA